MPNKEVVSADMFESSTTFMECVAPYVIDMLGIEDDENVIIQIEHKDDEIAVFLDTQCGIDYMHVYKNRSLSQGIAARVQKGKNWETFTIRSKRESGAKTEYEKRRYAIAHNGIYPYLTLQAYVDGRTVLGVGIIKTKDLYSYIDENSPKMWINRTNPDKCGQAEFIVCPWDDIKKRGYKLLTYCKR